MDLLWASMLRARSNSSGLGRLVRVMRSKKTVIRGVLQVAGANTQAEASAV